MASDLHRARDEVQNRRLHPWTEEQSVAVAVSHAYCHDVVGLGSDGGDGGGERVGGMLFYLEERSMPVEGEVA